MKTTTPPPPFLQPAPHLLIVPEGGGCISLFGLPFLLAGLGALSASLGLLPGSVGNSPFWPRLFLGAMGLVFAMVGGGLVFGRRWTKLDMFRGVITREWGLLVPLKTTGWPLSRFSHIALRFQQGDSDTADRYPVVLKSAGEQPDLLLGGSTEYQQAHQQAAFLASFLNRALEDATTDHGVVLPPEEADLAWVARPPADDPAPAEALRPAVLRSRIEPAAAGIRIVIPGPGLHLTAFFGLAFTAVMLAFVLPMAVGFFHSTQTPDAVAIIFVTFLLVFVGGPLLGSVSAFLQARRSRTVVTADASGLTLEERGAWRTVTTRLPAEDILDLDYDTADSTWHAVEAALPRGPAAPSSPPRWLKGLSRLARSKGVLLKTRHGLIAVGAGLPDEEVRYLHALLARSLRGV